jgi:hypothetical protein
MRLNDEMPLEREYNEMARHEQMLCSKSSNNSVIRCSNGYGSGPEMAALAS